MRVDEPTTPGDFADRTHPQMRPRHRCRRALSHRDCRGEAPTLMRPVLVDTSVWRRFFAGSTRFRALQNLLDEDGAVLVHPFIIGELVMGGMSPREEELFERLPAAAIVADEEVLTM